MLSKQFKLSNIIFKDKKIDTDVHIFNTKQVFSHCTKKVCAYKYIFWNNQKDASIFYSQLTYCKSCNHLCVSRVFTSFQMWSCFIFSTLISQSLSCSAS